MGVLAFITSILGGLCAIMGIINATLVSPLLVTDVDETFWFSLAVISLLAAIASLLSRGMSE